MLIFIIIVIILMKRRVTSSKWRHFLPSSFSRGELKQVYHATRRTQLQPSIQHGDNTYTLWLLAEVTTLLLQMTDTVGDVNDHVDGDDENGDDDDNERDDKRHSNAKSCLRAKLSSSFSCSSFFMVRARCPSTSATETYSHTLFSPLLFRPSNAFRFSKVPL